MEAEALEEQRIVNGVQVDELFGTTDNIKKAPVIAKFKFRANNKWIEGGHNRADVLYFLFILSILFSSCAPLASDYRREGFNFLQRSFESFKTTKDLNVTVVLKNVKIHIVSDRKHFPWDKASAYGSPVAGYATSGNEIFVFGKRLGGKIIVNQAILGHELNHLLNFQDPKVANPDELDQLEI